MAPNGPMRYVITGGHPLPNQGAGEQAHLHGAGAKSHGQSTGALGAGTTWALATFAVATAKSKATAAHKQSIFWVMSILLLNGVILCGGNSPA